MAKEDKISDGKRLFFGFEVDAPWPETYPKGRLLQENQRHLTIAFLGQVSERKIKKALSSIPSLPLKVGLVGVCDQLITLPPRHPKVIAWNVSWLSQRAHGVLHAYHAQLINWLKEQQLSTDDRSLLSHITLCRAPFDIQDWKKAFEPVPCMLKNFHLYESVGNLQYRSCWTVPVESPFEEIDHTADIAFLVRGEDFAQLYLHAKAALAFRFPSLLHYMEIEPSGCSTLEQIVVQLNHVVARVDMEEGCPFKAVSFHGRLINRKDSILEWEMIVDV